MRVELFNSCQDAPMGALELVPETPFERQWLRLAMTDCITQCVYTLVTYGSGDGQYRLIRRDMSRED